MTDSGQNPETPPDRTKAVAPAWAPDPVVGTPPPAAAPPPKPPDPYAVDATMRLIPVPHIPPAAPHPAAPPPDSAPTAEPPAQAQPAERHIGKYTAKPELARGGRCTAYLAEHPWRRREVPPTALSLTARPAPTPPTTLS